MEQRRSNPQSGSNAGRGMHPSGTRGPDGRHHREQPERRELDALIRRMADEQLPLSEITDLYIEAVIEAAGGNKVLAAKILGIDRKTLYRRAGRRGKREGD